MCQHDHSTCDGHHSGQVTVEDSTLVSLGDRLVDKTRRLDERFRLLFTIMNLSQNNVAVDQLVRCLFNDENSALLKHELAYCLGQMQNPYAVSFLQRVLADKNEHCMVRHEAAEALGAIGSPDCFAILKAYCNDQEQTVAETCQLAMDKLEFDQQSKMEDATYDSYYSSVDPAPADKESLSIDELVAKMMDSRLSLFQRYRAMFALRNKNSSEAAVALCKGFEEPSSALFRHEVAFVLGQMQQPSTAAYMMKVLKNVHEHEMVRHECAEALGSIASFDVLPILEEFSKDLQQVVKESCEVALDMYRYENSGQFQYADGLQQFTDKTTAVDS